MTRGQRLEYLKKQTAMAERKRCRECGGSGVSPFPRNRSKALRGDCGLCDGTGDHENETEEIRCMLRGLYYHHLCGRAVDQSIEHLLGVIDEQEGEIKRLNKGLVDANKENSKITFEQNRYIAEALGNDPGK